MVCPDRGRECLVRGAGWTLMLALCTILTGCAFRQAHYRSLLDLQHHSSLNYSQQVLDAIVGIQERAELPTFFYVEAGQSTWSPSVSSSLGVTGQLVEGDLKQITGGDSLNLSPRTGVNESLNSFIQFNDFGSAAMSRVSAIYAFLCYPIEIGGGKLPHGAYYTVVRQADHLEDLIIRTKTKDRRYVGVTEQTKFEFFKFSRDIIYWSRHSQPDPNDLESAAGNLYAFFAQYPAAELALSAAIHSASKAQNDYDGALSAYIDTFKQINQLEDEFRKSQDDPKVLTTILTETYQQRMIQFQQLGAASAEKKAKSENLAVCRQNIEALLRNLRQTVTSIKYMDPDGDLIDVDAIVKPFRRRIDGLLAGDREIVGEVQYQIPSTKGLDARESMDKLYRDRFESLPQRFETPFQSQD